MAKQVLQRHIDHGDPEKVQHDLFSSPQRQPAATQAGNDGFRPVSMRIDEYEFLYKDERNHWYIEDFDNNSLLDSRVLTSLIRTTSL